MKKSTHLFVRSLVLAFVFALIFQPAEAQEAMTPEQTDFKNVIKSNPFYTLAGWIPITYERFIGKSTSVVIGASYITNEPQIFAGIRKTYETRDGFYINPALRFYLFKNNAMPGGFYFSPEVGFIQQTKRLGADSAEVYHEPTSVKDSVYYTMRQFPAVKMVQNELQIGATIGYQAVIKNVFVIDLYAGEALGLVSFKGNVSQYYEHLNLLGFSTKLPPINGARLLAGVKIGMAF